LYGASVANVLDETRAERRDVGRFLATHEECASDFEIGRVSGGSGGRLRLVCRGCGERAVYDIGEPGVLELIDEPRPAKRTRRRITRAELERWLPAPAALPWWIPSAYIVVVILVGVALISVGLVARNDDDPVVLGGQGQQTPTATEPVFTETSPTPAPAVASSEKNGGGKDKRGKDKDKDNGRKGGDKPADPDLDNVTVLNRFVIGVPPGWLRGLSGGAVVFRSPSQEAELRVYLEPGDDGPRTLSRHAREYLESQHPSAKISAPRRIRLGGRPAVRIVASWDGGTERAALLSESGYSYLLLSRVDENAPRPVRTDAVAALYSFNVL